MKGHEKNMKGTSKETEREEGYEQYRDVLLIINLF